MRCIGHGISKISYLFLLQLDGVLVLVLDGHDDPAQVLLMLLLLLLAHPPASFGLEQ